MCQAYVPKTKVIGIRVKYDFQLYYFNLQHFLINIYFPYQNFQLEFFQDWKLAQNQLDTIGFSWNFFQLILDLIGLDLTFYKLEKSWSNWTFVGK